MLLLETDSLRIKYYHFEYAEEIHTLKDQKFILMKIKYNATSSPYPVPTVKTNPTFLSLSFSETCKKLTSSRKEL
jgi:hypothetical protein